MRPWGVVLVEVHVSQTEPELRSARTVTAEKAAMSLGTFSLAFALCPQETHTSLAWLVRLPVAMCVQGLPACDG